MGLSLSVKWDLFEGLVIETTTQFRSKYGGDPDEIFSEAQELFLKACGEHEEARSPLPVWIRLRIWYGLKNYWNKERRRKNKCRELKDVHAIREPRQFHTDGLDEHSMMMLNAVIQPDVNLECFICEQGKPTKRNIRRGLKEYFREQGWTQRRITKSFRRIRKYLQRC